MLGKVMRTGSAPWAPASAHVANTITKTRLAPIIAAAAPAALRAMVFIR
jgi:hypothetical protein